MTEALRVVAAVLFDGQRRVLIAQRPPGKHMAGFWEFPGGKIGPGESAERALGRELAEELGIELRRCHSLLQLRHDYADRAVALEVFVVDEYRGQPCGREAQALKWVPTAQLRGEELLVADRPVVEALEALAAE
jgi:8-oxo-dGTP diphosphatase